MAVGTQSATQSQAVRAKEVIRKLQEKLARKQAANVAALTEKRRLSQEDLTFGQQELGSAFETAQLDRKLAQQEDAETARAAEEAAQGTAGPPILPDARPLTGQTGPGGGGGGDVDLDNIAGAVSGGSAVKQAGALAGPGGESFGQALRTGQDITDFTRQTTTTTSPRPARTFDEFFARKIFGGDKPVTDTTIGGPTSAEFVAVDRRRQQIEDNAVTTSVNLVGQSLVELGVAGTRPGVALEDPPEALLQAQRRAFEGLAGQVGARRATELTPQITDRALVAARVNMPKAKANELTLSTLKAEAELKDIRLRSARAGEQTRVSLMGRSVVFGTPPLTRDKTIEMWKSFGIGTVGTRGFDKSLEAMIPIAQQSSVFHFGIFPLMTTGERAFFLPDEGPSTRPIDVTEFGLHLARTDPRNRRPGTPDEELDPSTDFLKDLGFAEHPRSPNGFITVIDSEGNVSRPQFSDPDNVNAHGLLRLYYAFFNHHGNDEIKFGEEIPLEDVGKDDDEVAQEAPPSAGPIQSESFRRSPRTRLRAKAKEQGAELLKALQGPEVQRKPATELERRRAEIKAQGAGSRRRMLELFTGQ